MPTAPRFNDPGYWHRRAEEARDLAQHMSNEKAKETMLIRLGRQVIGGLSFLATQTLTEIHGPLTLAFGGRRCPWMP
jgi:hypothetical protein